MTGRSRAPASSRARARSESLSTVDCRLSTERARASATAARAPATASPRGRSGSRPASSSTEGNERSRLLRSLSLDPAPLVTLDLLLPDRRLGLDAVDDLAGARERPAAVRRRRCHRDARLRQRNGADAVLRRRSAQPVRLHGGSDDRGDLLLGHLDVGLVLQRLDLARHPLESHDRARARVGHPPGQRVERKPVLRHARPHQGAARRGPAGHRRDQRQLVAGVEHAVVARVFAVDGHDQRQLRRRHVAERRQGVAHPRAIRKRQRHLARAGALPQHREQANGDLHGANATATAAPAPLNRVQPAMRRHLVTAIALAMLSVPASASAGTVDLVDSRWADIATKQLQFAAAPGEANRVTLAVTDGRYVLTDEGAALEARGPCTLEATNRASCPAPGLARAQIDLGDRDDTLTADLPVQQSGREDSFLSAYGGSGADDLRGSARLTYLTAGDDGTEPERLSATGGFQAFIYGSNGPDTITANAAGNDITGAGGDDTIIGASPEAPEPGAGTDRVSGGPGNDRIETGTGWDTLRGDDGADFLDSGPDTDELDGGDGDDVLTAGLHRDTLRGGPGDDTLDGGGGDTLGWNDPPTFEAAKGQFPDKLDGGPGADTLNGGGGDWDSVTYDGRQAPVLASLDGLRNDGERGERDLIGTDVEQVIGGEGDDTVRGSGNSNYLEGGAGDDVIDGGGGYHDVIYGRTGNDTIITLGGGGYHDVIYGRTGNDTIITLDGGLESRVGLEGPIPGTGYLWDDAIRCDDSPTAPGIDTAIIDPTDGGQASQLATGGCETVL